MKFHKHCLQAFQMVWDKEILHFMLSQTGSSSQGMVFIISLQRWLMWFDVDKCLVRRTHLLVYAPATHAFKSLIGCQKCQQWGIIPMPAGTLGVTSHLCWAWLAGSWLGNISRGLSKHRSLRVGPLLTYKTFIVQHH